MTQPPDTDARPAADTAAAPADTRPAHRKNASKARRWFWRALMGSFSTAAAILILLNVHDYPQTIGFYDAMARDLPEAQHRRWRGAFYFFNEAGSGIKFFVTDNERHMIHFPSPSHIVASRTARAQRGDWRAQLLLAQMYHNGDWVYRNQTQSDIWLQRALKTMPENIRREYNKT